VQALGHQSADVLGPYLREQAGVKLGPVGVVGGRGTRQTAGEDLRRQELREPAPGLLSVSVPTDPLPARLRGQVAEARPRPIDALAEDMMAAFDRVDQIAAASPLARTVTGRDASARLAVTLSAAGLASCTAPKAWVGQQTGSTLTSALGQALSAARDALAGTAGDPDPAGQPGQPDELGQLDQVFAEALAILTNPERLTGS
jgi:hypothetical protein